MADCSTSRASVHLHIQALEERVAAMYRDHGSYHCGDSGLDLFVVEDQTIEAGATAMIKFGIKASAWQAASGAGGGERQNVSFLVMARSSIYKTPLRLCNAVGLIDAGYRGEMMAVVDNVKSEAYTTKCGDRLVQAVGFTGGDISFELVESLDETARGTGGFGSTSTMAAAKAVGEEAAAEAERKRVTSPRGGPENAAGNERQASAKARRVEDDGKRDAASDATTSVADAATSPTVGEPIK